MKDMIYECSRKLEILYDGTFEEFDFQIVNLGTHPVAYIRIPKEHKYYNKHYDECDIDVHGGLTYSNTLKQINNSDGFWIGWDYAHYGDYCGTDLTLPSYLKSTSDKKWTTNEIYEHVKSVINQLKKV